MYIKIPSQGPEMEKVKNFITDENNSYNSSDNNKNPLCLYIYIYFNVKYFAVVSKFNFNYNIALIEYF